MVASLVLLASLSASAPAQPAASPAAGAAVSVGSRDATELWVEGNSAFRAGRFTDAVAAYEALLAAGDDDGEVWYNLGNAELRAGDLGRAIAAYRAAQRRMPRSEDVEANLRFARGRVSDAVAPPEPSTAARALLFWHYSLSPRELAAAAVALNAAFWAALAVALIAGRRAWRAPAAALGLAAAAVVGSTVVRVASPTTVAVVHREELPVASGPGDSTVIRFRLHAGAEALVTGAEDGWVRILLGDGMQGWVPADAVLLVDT